ncbi:MAG: cyclic nucleotide-binding domain-containing protein [Magnetococcales bacterium]|nr:cyclic nucleotide-binding domain-containing protein [Magnetococcales bacterium]
MKMTNKEQYVFLARIPGFKDLPKAYLEDNIIPHVEVAQFAKGETIVGEGEELKRVFIVKRGLGLCKSKNPELQEDQIYLEKGSILGDLDLVTGQPLSITVTAVSPTTCLTIDIDKFKKLLNEEFKFKRAFYIQAITQNIYITTKIEVGKYHKSGEFNFDIKKVYEQYKTLLAAIKKLRVFLNNDDDVSDKGWGKKNLITELLSYTQKYIQDKESALTGAVGVEQTEFRNIHQEFAPQIEALNSKAKGLVAESDNLAMLGDVQKFLGNWLLQNLMRDDASFAEYFNQKDVVKPSETAKTTSTKPQVVEQEVTKSEVETIKKVDVDSSQPKIVEPAAPEPEAPKPVTPEPVIPEPVAPEPEAPEPVVQELVAPEPVVQEPVAPEPVIPEPVVKKETTVPEGAEATTTSKQESLDQESNTQAARLIEGAELDALRSDSVELVGEIKTSKESDSWEWEQKILQEQALDEKDNGFAPPPPPPQSRNNMVFIGAVVVLLVGGGLLLQTTNSPKEADNKEPQIEESLPKKAVKQPEKIVAKTEKQDVAVVKMAAKEKLTDLAEQKPSPIKQASVKSIDKVTSKPQPDVVKQETKTVSLPAVPKKEPIVTKTVAVKVEQQPSQQLSSTLMNVDSEGIPRGPSAADKKGYFISMGCFSKKAFAVGQIKRVMKLSLPVYMKSIRNNTLHCVFGGPFPTKLAAQEGAERSKIEAKVENTVVKSY